MVPIGLIQSVVNCGFDVNNSPTRIPATMPRNIHAGRLSFLFSLITLSLIRISFSHLR